MSKRTIWLGLVAILLAAAALFWAFSPAAIPVETASVIRGPFRQVIADDGVTRVRDRYVVAAPVGGTLMRPAVRSGDMVARDAVVATIIPSAPQMLDPRTRAELLARRGAAEARLSRSGALLRQAQAALRQSEFDQRRITELQAKGFASRTERERADLEVDVRQKEVEALQFEQDAALHDVQQARAAVQFDANGGAGRDAQSAWKLRAPIAGQVLRVVQESEGEIAIGSPILEIGNVERLEALIDVLSSEATQIAPQAFVTLSAGPDIALAGRVRLVEPSARTKVSALGVEEQRVNVVVDLLPNPTLRGRIGDGFRVDAQIEIASEPDAVQVPVAALFRDADAWVVFVAKDGRALRRKAQLGPRNQDYAVVLNGLAPDERVIVYPSDTIRDESRIRPLADQ
jgi:HlyD family secretion protein